jgi:hypothetical protein
MNIPADDYEKLMVDSPEVNQLSFLSGLFSDTQNNIPCDSIASPDSATENSPEHIGQNRFGLTAKKEPESTGSFLSINSFLYSYMLQSIHLFF